MSSDCSLLSLLHAVKSNVRKNDKDVSNLCFIKQIYKSWFLLMQIYKTIFCCQKKSITESYPKLRLGRHKKPVMAGLLAVLL